MTYGISNGYLMKYDNRTQGYNRISNETFRGDINVTSSDGKILIQEINRSGNQTELKLRAFSDGPTGLKQVFNFS